MLTNDVGFAQVVPAPDIRQHLPACKCKLRQLCHRQKGKALYPQGKIKEVPHRDLKQVRLAGIWLELGTLQDVYPWRELQVVMLQIGSTSCDAAHDLPGGSKAMAGNCAYLCGYQAIDTSVGIHSDAAGLFITPEVDGESARKQSVRAGIRSLCIKLRRRQGLTSDHQADSCAHMAV